MKPIVDPPLCIKDFDLWVLSKALKEDSKKYEEGLRNIVKAKDDEKRNWFIRKLIGDEAAHKAVSLLEQSLSREIDFYPFDIQQIFLLTEGELREKGFTTGYQFKDIRIAPNDTKLENDLENLANPLFGTAEGCIEIKPDEKHISPHYVISAGKGKVPIICDLSTPFDMLMSDLFCYKVLQIVERAERTEKQLKQKMGNYVDKLSEKVSVYSSLTTSTNGIGNLYSLSTSNKVSMAWQNIMKQIEVKTKF